MAARTVRDHLRRQFFKDHLSRYSKSRRKAPIYWPLTVPSRNWGVWVYAPTLSRETLYAVASEAARRERLAVEAIARLQREQHEGGAGRPARKVAEELDAEEKLAEELRRFRAEAERIAGLGWEPDLDDGIVLCAAPLADLFPAWPDAKKARDELRKGQYEWATVAQWAERAVTTALRDHLAAELAKKVSQRGVVVWQDTDHEYADVAASLCPPDARFAAYDGSWYALRREVESLLAGDTPPKLVVYAPGPSPSDDPLEEIRAAGVRFADQARARSSRTL